MWYFSMSKSRCFLLIIWDQSFIMSLTGVTTGALLLTGTPLPCTYDTCASGFLYTHTLPAYRKVSVLMLPDCRDGHCGLGKDNRFWFKFFMNTGSCWLSVKLVTAKFSFYPSETSWRYASVHEYFSKLIKLKKN